MTLIGPPEELVVARFTKIQHIMRFTVMINNSRFGKVCIIGQLVGLVYPETIVILTISSNHHTAFVDMQPAATAGNKFQLIPNESLLHCGAPSLQKCAID